MTEYERENGDDAPEEEEDDLLEAQEGKGYGEDEGERDESLADDE